MRLNRDTAPGARISNLGSEIMSNLESGSY